MRFQRDKLWALRILEGKIGNPDASVFRQSLLEFISQLPHADVNQFSSFHSMTTVFEFFAAYLMIRLCRVAVLIPQSWIDFHLPWFAYGEQSLLSEEISNEDRRIDVASLRELTICYCQLLSRVDSLSGPHFRLGKTYYPSRLLHQRDMELLALIVVNLGFSNNVVQGFKELWQVVCQVCDIFLGQSMQLTFILGLLPSLY